MIPYKAEYKLLVFDSKVKLFRAISTHYDGDAAIAQYMKFLGDNIPCIIECDGRVVRRCQNRIEMLYGETDRTTMILNGWHVGTILEGEDRLGNSHLFKITAVGEERILGRWKYNSTSDWSRECSSTLSDRVWSKLSQVEEKINIGWEKLSSPFQQGDDYER